MSNGTRVATPLQMEIWGRFCREENERMIRELQGYGEPRVEEWRLAQYSGWEWVERNEGLT